MSTVHTGVLMLVVGLAVACVTQAREKEETLGQVSVGRYLTLQPVATHEQADVLQTVVTVQFPQKIVTVGEALDHLLLRSGYRLAETKAMDPGMRILLTRPLPEVHRTLGPITLEEALTTLAGHVYRLVVDPLNRLIAFDVKDKYRSLMQSYSAPIRPRQTQVAPKHGANVSPEEPLVDERDIVEVKPMCVEEKLDSKLYGTGSVGTPEKQAAIKASAPCANPYTVQKNETLSKVAMMCARQKGVSARKMAYGLYKHNPGAFGRIVGVPHINLLRAHQKLNLPTDAELAKLSESEAVRFEEKQRQLWKQPR